MNDYLTNGEFDEIKQIISLFQDDIECIQEELLPIRQVMASIKCRCEKIIKIIEGTNNEFR